MTFPMTEDWYTRLPPPDALTVGGLQPGAVPHFTLTYKLSDSDNVEELAELFGEAFSEAVAASTDGTVKVRVE